MTKHNCWRKWIIASIRDAHDANFFPLLYLYPEPENRAQHVVGFSILAVYVKQEGSVQSNSKNTSADSRK